jgi:hypothetical protein
MTAPVSDTLRETFRVMADLLIPKTDTMPSGSEVGVHGTVLDKILQLRPDLAPHFIRGVERAVGLDPAVARDLLDREDQPALIAIGLVASLAFYMDPVARRAIGYPGQERRPVQPGEESDIWEGGMLQRVIDRGPIFRPTPSG